MASLERRVRSFVLSLFDALEENTQQRFRILAAAGGMLATIGMWAVHLSYPYLLHSLIELGGRPEFLAALTLVFFPPFAVAFSIGSLITCEADEPDNEESGPMSGYFYRERADKRWRILFVAAIIAAANVVFMMVTSEAR
jgi:hypothetical protein